MNTIYNCLDGARHEIRLLRLRPAVSMKAPLRIRLFRGSFDVDGDLPPYEALSYVWGPPEAVQHSVLVEKADGSIEDQSIPVTANLDAALRHLRYRTIDRTLWVDALCINQVDVEERSMQVQQMKLIYERCTTDLAWLGPDATLKQNSIPTVPVIGNGDVLVEARTAQAEEAEKTRIERIKWAKTRADRLRDGLRLMTVMSGKDNATLATMMKQWRRYNKDDPEDIYIYQEGEDEDNDKDGEEIRDTQNVQDEQKGWFLNHDQKRQLSTTFTYAPFWSRVWIVQELTCAPRVMLVVGADEEAETAETEAEDHVLTLDFDSAIVNRFLGDRTYADAFHAFWGHGEVRPVLSSIFSRIKAIQLQRTFVRRGVVAEQQNEERDEEGGEERRWKGDANSLINVLARFKWTHSTDPRDKVYGLLGLVAEKSLLPRVDYAKPAADVYADAALAIIQASGGCLDLLSQNPFQGDDDSGSNSGEDNDDGNINSNEDEDEDKSLPGGSSRRVPSLPSWVPNFDRSIYPDYQDEFSTILFAQRGIYAAGRPRCLCSTSALEVEVPTSATLATNRNENGNRDRGRDVRKLRGLCLRGVVLGHVAPLRQGPWTEPGTSPVYPALLFAFYREWAALYGIELLPSEGAGVSDLGSAATTYLPTGEPLWQAYWRTLVGDCTAYPIKRLSADEIETCNAGLAAASQLRDQEVEAKAKAEAEEVEEVDKPWRTLTPAEALLAKVPCFAMLQRMTRRRTFAQTDGGLFLMARATVRAGDVVVVLDGSKVPVLLRRRGLRQQDQGQWQDDATETFRFVGTAYVHGFMDSQAVGQVEEGKLNERRFVLV